MSCSSASRRAFAAAAFLVGLAGSAFAHVIARPDSGAAGTPFIVEFFVGHGCAGAATVSLHVDLPPGITGVTPRDKPGWTVVRTDTSIEWRGGRIDGHGQDSFFVALTLPDTPGRTLYFPALQVCEKSEARWVEIPAAGQDRKSLKEPAPFVTIGPRTP